MHIFMVGWNGGGRCEICIPWADYGDIIPYPRILVSLSLAAPREGENWDRRGWWEQGGSQTAERARHSLPSKIPGLHVLKLSNKRENRRRFSIISATEISFTGIISPGTFAKLD